MTDNEQESKSWSAYWTQGQNPITCLPGAPQIFGNLLDGIWGDLAKSLNDGDRVIDLACGSGAAGAAVLNGRENLEVEGVDYADLPDSIERYFPIEKASLSDLPYDDSRFQCALSQFGIEYADASAVGSEIGRVLAPGARFQFIVHHAESVILKTNLTRREILQKVNGSEIEKAVRELDLQKLQSFFNAMFQDFGQHDLVFELANAVRATLSRDKEATGKLIADLKNSMSQEIQIITSLEKAAIVPNQLSGWQQDLGSAFQFEKARIVELGDDILCWDLSGTFEK